MFFFFKQKTAYEMRISDWSSDVCSSDLGEAVRRRRLREGREAEDDCPDRGRHRARRADARGRGRAHRRQSLRFREHAGGPPPQPVADRKSVVSGKSVSVRVDLGGRRIINTKKHLSSILTNLHLLPKPCYTAISHVTK